MNDTLLVVPVRSGSRGIPRKAIRPLNGKPPLRYTLEMARDLGDVVVITDAEDLRAIAVSCGVRVLEAPQELLAPALTWEPVVAYAVQECERLRAGRYSLVGVLQCTSPLLKRETVERCLAALEGYPVALTVRDDRHARIGTPRMPRERMPACWKVTGGCTAIRRDRLVATAWPVEQGMPIVVEGAEAVDLDTPEDWAIAEMYAGITERELLLAKVVVPNGSHGQAVILSAWDDRADAKPRFRMAAAFPHAISLQGINTREEAEKAVAGRSGNDLTIVTSAYHAPRAFLTFLKVLQEQGLDRTVKLWTAPAPSKMDGIGREWSKISEYQAKGHVASFEDGLTYLEWRDS
jgi:CMP-N-acetylneuraminic acid synthetase